MLNLLCVYAVGTHARPAVAVAAIVIGLTMRVALMVQPETRFQPYWRQLFVKTRPPQKHSN
jgi:hypothetical protein